MKGGVCRRKTCAAAKSNLLITRFRPIFGKIPGNFDFEREFFGFLGNKAIFGWNEDEMRIFSVNLSAFPC